MMTDEERLLRRLMDNNERRILDLKGIIAFGVGRRDDRPVFKVYYENEIPPETRAAIPDNIEGYAVIVESLGIPTAQ